MVNYIKKITSGDSEILGSGTLITFDEKPVQIDFGNDKETLILIIEFLNDSSVNGYPIRPTLLNSTTLKLTLINFKNSLGVGTVNPIPIGELNNKKLYLGIRVRSLNENTKQLTIHYTIYQKNKNV